MGNAQFLKIYLKYVFAYISTYIYFYVGFAAIYFCLFIYLFIHLFVITRWTQLYSSRLTYASKKTEDELAADHTKDNKDKDNTLREIDPICCNQEKVSWKILVRSTKKSGSYSQNRSWRNVIHSSVAKKLHFWIQ